MGIKQLFRGYFRSAYKLKTHIGINKYNLSLVSTLPKVKFKKRWLKKNDVSRN